MFRFALIASLLLLAALVVYQMVLVNIQIPVGSTTDPRDSAKRLDQELPPVVPGINVASNNNDSDLPVVPSSLTASEAATSAAANLEPESTVAGARLDDKTREAKAQQAHDALQAGFQNQMAALKKEIQQVESKQEQLDLLVSKNPTAEFVVQHLELAKKFHGTKAAMSSLLFVVGVTKGEPKNQAMLQLVEGYAGQLRLDKMADSFKREVPSQDIENWYLKMIEHADKDEIKASVMYDYAKYVSQLSVFRKTLAINPQVAAKLPQSQLDYINTPRTEEQDQAMATNLRAIVENYGEIARGQKTYGVLANKELFDLERLQVGDVAPDIVGKDLDGVEFRLSDYRGKVVLLDFWGHWCPPCRALYSKEQAISLKMADTPFVLLGVNSDPDLETARNAVESEGLSWRHFWNGPQGTSGPISEQWNVEGWPTFYLIDGEGVIRYKQVAGQDIEAGIEKLMAEMGHTITLADASE